jgi:hypothetical protein
MSVRRQSGTSAVFDAWEALYERLSSTVLPPSDDGYPGPEVILGTTQADYPREAVYVATRVDDNDAEWATLGNPSRDETFQILVRFECDVPGRDGVQVLRRMREVSDAVQQALRDEDGQPAWLGFDGEVRSMQVQRVVPLITGGAEGALGRVDHFVQIRARI